ncbi:hypothetical protein AURDEDRAFT_165882 [Auricularia subglabra TFB-10046 SS5]|nr:hypothetical protein AURDEDRAFT_165882 [Auricularia subglabra TFB-10046 SS5]
MLENTRLWSRLTLHAYDAYDSADVEFETVSNIDFLRRILRRSGPQPLTLHIDIRSVEPTEEFKSKLVNFIGLVAPRLAALRGDAEWFFLGQVLCEYQWAFPDLRALSLSQPFSEPDYLRAPAWIAEFAGDKLPNLASFSLHELYRLRCSSVWCSLQSLTCTVNTLLDIEPLLLSSSSLECLKCGCLPDLFSDDDDWPRITWPRPALLAALSRIPDVCITSFSDATSAECVFYFFTAVPRPRLLMCFIFGEDSVSFRPVACTQLSSARRLTISDGNNSILVVPEDGSNRIFEITLSGLPSAALNPPIDWELVPPFDSLLSMCVDAALWPAVMHGFPQAPLLARVTLNFREAGDIDALLAQGPIYKVPQSVRLTLTAEMPVAVTGDQVEALTAALGVAGVVEMTGGVYQAG